MRKDAKDDDYTPDSILGQKLNWYADKIEEIAEDPADRQITPPDEGVFLGNHAAAIESLNHIIYWAKECVAGRMSHNDFLINVQCSAAAARSLPARNCDVYRTKEEAEKAFLSEPCDEPCGNCTIKDINNECGVKWLFAEHKGKAKK